MFFKLSLIFSLVSLFVSVTYALYEDQVGKFDWKLSYVGEIIYSKVDLEGKSPRVYVATERNIVASINAKNGKIVWRHLLESGEDGIIRALYVGNEVVSVSGSGPYIIRGWNKSTGLQLYEWSTPPTLPKEGLWTVDQQKAYQLRLGTNMVQVTGFHLKSGNPAGSTKAITSAWISSPSRCAVQNGALTCLSAEGNGLTSMTLADLGIKSGAISAGPGVVNVSSVGGGLLIRKNSDGAKVASFDTTGALVTSDVSIRSASTVFKSYGGTVLVKVSRDPKILENLDVEFIVLEINKSFKHKVVGKFPFARPLSVSAFCNLATEIEPNCLALVSMEDEAACMIQKGKLLWVREEALANIIGVEMIELPVSDEEAALETELANKGEDSSLTSGVVGMLSRRLHSQVIQLHNLVSAILGLIDPSISGSRSRQLVKDAFGLHKLILLSTKNSKIFALDNQDGEIVWQTYLRTLEPLKSFDGHISPIFVLRPAKHIPYSTMATILLKEKKSGNSVLYVFDPVTGSTADGGLVLLGKKVLQCMVLPEHNDDFISGLLLLMEDGDIQVYPPSTTEVALRTAHNLYMYTADPATGAVEGLKFFKNLNTGSLATRKVWSLKLPYKLVAVVGKRREERVHSQGRVLGDRSVLYKYVNPNLVVAATVSPDPVLKSIVNIYLIDTVSGAIIFTSSHKRASEPVHIVHSENWIVYSFFSEKFRRTEMITLDLYEGKTQRNTTAFSSLDPSLDPLIERQAYIFPHNIVTMKETITEKGITSKHVLLALTSGGVMEMPWVLLDPRRSVTPTPEMREEGIVPYIPELGLPHEAIITYNHTLEAIQGIHTSPSGLESTCLVFIYGLDLFYTRVTPSKTFDVLKDDFEYWLITAVLAGLVTAAYVTKRLASRKALMQAWK